MKNTEKKIPAWFWTTVVIILLWNLIGLINFFQHLFITEEQLGELPQAHQDIIRNMPGWIFVVFGTAVFCGVGGGIALLLKRKTAKLLFILSFIASAIQLGRSVFENEFEFYGTTEIIISALIISFLLFSIWLSKYASDKNWLR